ncbi:MAG: glycerol kinase [Zetaproteobacteria bacterium]|nr:glycerol kinase [Pseudobdellovibrionaceae bacterium]
MKFRIIFMNHKFILAIDQGTSGTTSVVFLLDEKEQLSVLGRSTIPFEQHYPAEGWVEHDLNEIWRSVEQSVEQACLEAASKPFGFAKKKIISIGITNQRETLCVYDRESTQPACKAIVWQCKRSLAVCQKLKSRVGENEFSRRTGLVLDPYFTGSKIRWLIENNEPVRLGLEKGKLVCGTIDSFLVSRLTSGRSFVTEASNASRTLLFNIETMSWDPFLLKHMKVPSESVLPEIKNSADEFGYTNGLTFLPDAIPICGILGDQQAALAGQGGFSELSAKCTYGTGAFLLVNTGGKIKRSRHGLLSTVAWSLKGNVSYALEGASFIAGAAVQFLRDNLKIISSHKDLLRAENFQAAPEIYFVPALSGLGAPWWNPSAQGAFLGLTRATKQEQVLRAALEGIAFQVNDLLLAFKEDLGRSLSDLRVDGGAASNDLLLTIQANLSSINIQRSFDLESTARGAAKMAVLGSQVISSERVLSPESSAKIFTATKGLRAQRLREDQYAGWIKAVRAIELFASSKVD